jgi:hypothetical protein
LEDIRSIQNTRLSIEYAIQTYKTRQGDLFDKMDSGQKQQAISNQIQNTINNLQNRKA